MKMEIMQLQLLKQENQFSTFFKHLNAKLNPTCHLLALSGAHHTLHVSRIGVKNKSATSKRQEKNESIKTCSKSK
jgi:hypothetical protein